LSSLALDRFSPGRAEDAAARAHVEGCERCRLALQERQRAREAFAAEHDIPRLAARVIDRSRPRRALRWLAPLAAAAVVMLFVGRMGPDEYVRVKGGVSLRVVVARGSGAQDLKEGDSVKAGDRLRFVADSDRPGWIAVWGRDEAGTIWRGAPPAGAAMLRIEAGPARVLDGAVLLDAVGSSEEIFSFFCAEVQSERALEQAMKRGARPELSGCTVQRLSLRKTP
jgi:hypothetical protein